MFFLAFLIFINIVDTLLVNIISNVAAIRFLSKVSFRHVKKVQKKRLHIYSYFIALKCYLVYS